MSSVSLTTARQEYNAIDVVKFIASLLVISIHFHPFAYSKNIWFNYIDFGIVNYIARLAVPFFFVCSGFFLFQKISAEHFSWIPVKKYIVRVFNLYLLWSVIYLPFSFNTDRGYLYAVLNYIHHFIFVGSYTHLWYLNALIFATFFVALLLYLKISFRFILAFSFFMYFIGLFAQSWFGFILPLQNICPLLWELLLALEKVIVTTRNGLFEGFIFVAIGAYFAQSRKNMKPSHSLCGFLLSMLCLFLEVFALNHFKIVRASDMYLFLVPAAFFLFSLLSQIHLPDHSIFKELRLLSTLIYYLQFWPGNVITHLPLLQDRSALTYFIRFVLIVILSILCSCMTLWLSRKPKFQFLKRLY